MNKRRCLISALCVFLGLGSCSNVSFFSAVELRELLEKEGPIQIIDIRSPQKFADGHLKGAKNIPIKKNFKERVSSFDRKTPLLVYCGRGLKTDEAVEILQNLRFRKIYVLRDGLNVWEEEGFPLEK